MQSNLIGSVQFSPQVNIVIQTKPQARDRPFPEQWYLQHWHDGRPRPIDSYFKSVKHNI